eukprot:CAMPEP_0204569024 /NCGR_PEP_ID=MMETSP0661-20131031/37512_1 /ASSEMBLY_ACC=CAM_ASM_000606 /TAXON_ID=109239 /ORGANISM="Alexandrium margalefi, Strain AMGDE01CS-322" /LENGTH=98 /DNA_ID=CAMNT_0051577087 /DNA_START=29 /DNA_END=325 /DNA_ORIENTATION=-
MACGAVGTSQAATAEVQALCDKVKAEIEGKAGATYSTFTATSYATQVVSGTNYFVKIDVGGAFIHARIYQGLPHTGPTVSVAAVQTGKTADDAITHFE